MMSKTGVIILVHGSRGERGSAEIAETLDRLGRGVSSFLDGGVEVAGAALQFNHPDLEEAAARLVGNGAGRIIIVPYFLFTGRHITEHVPEMIEKMQAAYPGREFILADSLGLDEYLVDLVARRVLEAAPELSPEGHEPPPAPQDIEATSMDIVARLLPPLQLPREELAVTKRLVHTAGDRHIASLVRFHPVAVRVALAAIRSGQPVFTDVHMVAVAINRRLAEKYGCAVRCALDEAANGAAPGGRSTRTAAAFRQLDGRLNEAIVAIGNSPTALMTLLDLIREQKAGPALVIGMPVGFVQARESKERLMAMDVPYISIAGTRGGSALAAATVNALLKLAAP